MKLAFAPIAEHERAELLISRREWYDFCDWALLVIKNCRRHETTKAEFVAATEMIVIWSEAGLGRCTIQKVADSACCTNDALQQLKKCAGRSQESLKQHLQVHSPDPVLFFEDWKKQAATARLPIEDCLKEFVYAFEDDAGLLEHYETFAKSHENTRRRKPSTGQSLAKRRNMPGSNPRMTEQG